MDEPDARGRGEWRRAIESSGQAKALVPFNSLQKIEVAIGSRFIRAASGDDRQMSASERRERREARIVQSTRATKFLEQSGVAFTGLELHYDPDADEMALQAAQALGEAPQRVLKR